jgi:hypothetical protein
VAILVARLAGPVDVDGTRYISFRNGQNNILGLGIRCEAGGVARFGYNDVQHAYQLRGGRGMKTEGTVNFGSLDGAVERHTAAMHDGKSFR